VLPPFELLRPSSVPEAAGLLSEDRVGYCGGTELLLAMKAGLLRPDALVDLKRLPELRTVTVEGDQLVIGATTTHLAISRHPLVQQHAPMLVDVENRVGNARVRAQGSIGGNLCFAEPKSDVGTALVAHRATLRLTSAAGSREVPVEEFLEGPYSTTREPEELLVSISIPLQPARRAVYLKYQTMERPTVGVAAVSEGPSAACRLVVGAVGEELVVVDVDDPADIDADDIAGRIDPIADLTGSVRYKRHITALFVRRATAALVAQAAS
jgi:carbon-monoxide dehydrogenase medium subunit